MMRYRYGLMVALLTAGMSLLGQNPVTVGTPENDTLFMGSGLNFLLIPEVDDGDGGVDQEVTFTVTSSDPAVLEVNDVSYAAGQTVAVVHVTEKGVTGTVTLQVEAVDADGTASTSFDVFIGPYNNPGINFEIHDIVFWQQFVPLESNPAFSMIAPDGVAPYDQIDLPSLNLSVYSDCQDVPPCTGTDFFTAFFKGYLIPPVTGEYFFNMIAGDQCSIGLSSDESFDHIQVILHSSDGIGTNPANKEWRSIQVSLEAGKTYAIYGTQWNIHTLIGGMLWEGPGIEKEYIPGAYLSYVYDVVKPSTPGAFTLVTTGINDLIVDWDAATDDRNLAGYNVYINGRRAHEDLLTETFYQVTSLLPGTQYSVLVTSVDRAGNESAESTILTTTTYVSDGFPPAPPTTLEASIISDLSFKLSWSGASDGETEVRGYHLYVDGELYNATDLIYDEETLVLGLTPQTEYQVEVVAVDAGLNESVKSDPLSVTTTAFDPNDTSISDKKARLTVIMDPVGRSDGLGVNPSYTAGQFLNDPEQIRLIRELEVAGLRWGALDANPLNFEDHIGTGKAMTIGRMMDFCNEIGAYTIITCGVKDGTDWRTDPQTFLHFLEYLAGPADSGYGAIRASEGYTDPLLDRSRGLVFEFGNEVWGAAAHDAEIGSDYGEYGAWCREMATLMRASAYYDEDKIYLVYSGRRPVSGDSYGLHESLLEGDRGEVDWLAVSGYLGGNLDYAPEIDPGKTELDYYKNGIAEMARNLDGLKGTMDIILQASGDFKPTYMYEANMTHESYFGRLGQAIVQTDYYASVVETGGVIPTVFHLTGGQWKMVVPAQDYAKTPLFYTTQYYNKYCKGTALRTELETSAIITSARGTLVGLDPVGCHVYAKEDAFSVLLISRDFEHDFTVQVDLPDDLQLISPETGMKYVVSGEGFSDKEATIDSAAITMSDSLLVTVPRHSMVILSFGGDGSSVEQVPLGFYDYVSATSVSIYAYGTDVLDITGREKKILLTEVLPENVLSDAVIWSVDTNNVRVVYGLKSYGFEVMGSGTCDGNGTITVRASAWDNPEVYDEVVINISNQGTDCNVGVTAPPDQPFCLYPIPARDILYVEGIRNGGYILVITDITGRRCLIESLTDLPAKLDITTLESGIYYLSITGIEETFIRSFVKE